MADEHIWDEERWESFLSENDRRVDRFMECFNRFLRDNPQPDAEHQDAMKVWEGRLEAFLARELGWKRGLDRLPFWMPENEEDDEDDGVPDPINDLESLPIYQRSMAFTHDVLDWSESLPGDVKDSNLVQFCTNVMQITVKIAGGHALGTNRDFIGGYIASVKRALKSANVALDLLPEMQEAPYMKPEQYAALYEKAFELRNDLGVWVQDLRDRFELGLD